LGQFLAGLARVLSGAHVSWNGCAPSLRQRVYYFNHTSHADSVLLWAVLPPDVRAVVRPVAAQEYWFASRLRRFVAGRVFRAIFVSRKATALEDRQLQVRRMVEGLGQENSLILSPEGTRGSGEEILPFKSGLYYLCCERPDLELVPVYLENLSRLLPKGEFIPLPLLCRVSFGPPLRWNPGESKHHFLERTRQALLDLAEVD
jgi:1-acyl-sn-glycerol-3-phosphate acyltransferase